MRATSSYRLHTVRIERRTDRDSVQVLVRHGNVIRHFIARRSDLHDRSRRGVRRFATAAPKDRIREHEDFPLRGFVECCECDRRLTAAWSRERSKLYGFN